MRRKNRDERVKRVPLGDGAVAVETVESPKKRRYNRNRQRQREREAIEVGLEMYHEFGGGDG